MALNPLAQKAPRKRYLASIFTSYGGYGSGQHVVAGMKPAVYVGAAIVAVGALLAFAIGKRSPHAPKISKRDQLATEIATTEAAA